MAQINKALSKTLAFEGGYVDDPLDRGGETYKGISRANFPSWSGWKDIDNYKNSYAVKVIDAVLKNNVQVQAKVALFYELNFWDKVGGDHINSQEVANNIFDFAINSGVSRAVKYAQRVAGTLEDGIIGAKTLAAINAMDEEKFITQYKASRKEFLKKITLNNPSQLRFLNGWMNRVENA